MIPAGRELDALIAEKVMQLEKTSVIQASWNKTEGFTSQKIGEAFVDVPHYSTNIADAWLVFEHLGKKGKACQVIKRGNLDWWAAFEENKISFSQESAPHAICLAALNALGVEV